MKNVVIGIFAHPDDAAFGPGGSLALAAADGAEVHLICVTCGGAGVNVDSHMQLCDVREAEEQQAATCLGVSSVELLRYDDGQLCNALYLEIAERIMAHIRGLVSPNQEVLLTTFEPSGLSGHLDHVAVSMITTYAYLQLRAEYAIKLRYYCLPDTRYPRANTNWLYMPRGRRPEEIDEVIDVSRVRDQKLAAMDAHRSQRSDAEAIKRHLGDDLFRECFWYYRD